MTTAYYMTPARYRSMQTGVDLTGVGDLAIAEMIVDATAVVDSYCSVPYGFSFLGGRAVDEQVPWHYSAAHYDRGSRRVYPKNTPVIEVEEFILVVGAEASASLPLDHLVINNQERWIEVTAATLVTASGLFGVTGWVIPFGGLTEPIAQLTYTYGRTFAADDRLYPSPDGADLVWQAPHGFWSASPTPVISDAGVDLAEDAGYSLDLEEGRVTFDVAPSGPVRAVYSHRLPREIESATALIVSDLMGSSELVSKGMAGLKRITDDTITIERQQADKASAMGGYLEIAVPKAAQLLDGWKMWSMAAARSNG